MKCQQELQLTVERLRQIEQDQHAQLTESESTTNYLERRIHDLDKVCLTMNNSEISSVSELDHSSTDGGETTDHVEVRSRND